MTTFGIDSMYEIADERDEVMEFIGETPVLADLLLEAVPPLRKAFGGDKVRKLRMVAGGGEAMLVVSVTWPGSEESAEAAREKFLDDWWLANCHRAEADLIFDYELVEP
jgi:hypothetical protein